ncbi:MAG: Uma2 family endonuclease [Lyngbya sp.]|nr:Uma2 family endonuclease [Lyngbya sp.]
MTNFTLNLESIELTDEQFFQLCQNNRDLKFERNSNGDLVIMSPTGGETGRSNFEIAVDLGIWNRQTKLGVAFDSSTGFKLPNGAVREAWATPIRSPDAAWITLERWESLTSEQRRKFIPLCPDFVIELRSASDRLNKIQDKMQEYIDNGVRLGWLINPIDKTVEIYRQNQEVRVLESPTTLSGEDVLPGFILNLQEIW